MKLRKIKIGSFVERYNEKCGISNLTVNDISGINRDKEFFEPSKQAGADTSNYKVVPPDYFACNLMHVGRDVVLPISINHTTKNKIVSPAYTVFYITDESIILKEYFFMFLKSDEKDRFFWFNTDSSVRDGMEWDVFCDVEILIPDIETQKQKVSVFLNLQRKIDVLGNEIDITRHLCDVLLDQLMHFYQLHPVGEFIEQTDNRNSDLAYGQESVMGMTITKEIMPTKANVATTDLANFKIVFPGEFVYNPRTHGRRIGLGFNQDKDPFIITWNNTAFKIKESAYDQILPEYLYMYFCRDEWDREACFRSWGSSTEVFSWDSLCEMRISVPPLELQKDVIALYHANAKRIKVLEEFQKIRDRICPVLIAGTTEEGEQ